MSFCNNFQQLFELSLAIFYYIRIAMVIRNDYLRLFRIYSLNIACSKGNIHPKQHLTITTNVNGTFFTKNMSLLVLLKNGTIKLHNLDSNMIIVEFYYFYKILQSLSSFNNFNAV